MVDGQVSLMPTSTLSKTKRCQNKPPKNPRLNCGKMLNPASTQTAEIHQTTNLKAHVSSELLSTSWNNLLYSNVTAVKSTKSFKQYIYSCTQDSWFAVSAPLSNKAHHVHFGILRRLPILYPYRYRFPFRCSSFERKVWHEGTINSFYQGVRILKITC